MGARVRVSRQEPHRFATWLLTRCTSDYRRDSFIGDLLEQYEERGGWWYWLEAVAALRVHTGRLFFSAMERDIPAAEFIGDLLTWVALGACGLVQLGIYAHLLGVVVYRPHLVDSEPSFVVGISMIVLPLIGAAITVQRAKQKTARATRARWLRALHTRIASSARQIRRSGDKAPFAG